MKSRLSFVLLFSTLFSFIFLTSCQKDEIGDPDGPISYRDASSFSYSVNPAQVGDSIVITYDALNGADCGHIHIQVSSADGENWSGGKPAVPDSGVATRLFIPGEPGEYRVRAKYQRTGNPKTCDFESSGWYESTELLIVEGDTTESDTTGSDTTGTCEAAFTADSVTCDSSSRTVVFTFTSDTDLDYVKIKGNLSKGLTEDAEVTVAGADFDVVQKKSGNSTGRIFTLEGSAEACVPITITITWDSNHNGPHLTSAWTALGGGVNLEVGPVQCE